MVNGYTKAIIQLDNAIQQEAESSSQAAANPVSVMDTHCLLDIITSTKPSAPSKPARFQLELSYLYTNNITMILHVHMVPTYAQVFVNLNIFPKFCKGEVVVKSLQSA